MPRPGRRSGAGSTAAPPAPTSQRSATAWFRGRAITPRKATSTSFWSVSRAFVRSTPPHTRRVLRSTCCIRGPGADWCLESDVVTDFVTNLGLQAVPAGRRDPLELHAAGRAERRGHRPLRRLRLRPAEPRRRYAHVGLVGLCSGPLPVRTCWPVMLRVCWAGVFLFVFWAPSRTPYPSPDRPYTVSGAPFFLRIVFLSYAA